MRSNRQLLAIIVGGQLLASAVGLWLHSTQVSVTMQQTLTERAWADLGDLLTGGGENPNADDAEIHVAQMSPTGGLIVGPDDEPINQTSYQILHAEETSTGVARWLLKNDAGEFIAVGQRRDNGGFDLAMGSLAEIRRQVHAVTLRNVPIAILSAVWMAAIVGLVAYLALAKHQDGLIRRELESAKAAQKQTQQYVRARDAIIFALAKLADSRDPETGEHLERIVRYSGMIASAARQHPRFAGEISPSDVRLIQLSSALHDIGKVGIDDRVLQKRGKLTESEMEEMKRHTIVAGECLGKIAQRAGDSGLLKMARDVALCHHERWDGGGYPRGMSGTQIPLAARIVAIADVYDALSSARVYKEPFPHEKCVEIIRDGSGSHFDPQLVDVWLSIEGRFRSIAQSHVRHALEEPAKETSAFAETPAPTAAAPAEPATVAASPESTDKALVGTRLEAEIDELLHTERT